MSKFASFAGYPKRSLAGAEAALLTAWASLSRYHDHLVLVGGLAVKYLTKPGAGLLPGPVTMNVDLGVTLAAEGGQFGTIADDLTGQGFTRDKNGRCVRQFEAMPVFIDFLTEHPTATSGTVSVDGVPAGVFPGGDRALATRQNVTLTGTDLFGVAQKFDVLISGIGPLLVLKLNASNRGLARAKATLRKHFLETSQSGPIRCAAFALEGQGATDDFQSRQRQILEQMVTVGRALLGMT